MRLRIPHWLKLIKRGKLSARGDQKGTQGFGIEKLEAHFSLNLEYDLEEK
jgi:hypothetical protein